MLLDEFVVFGGFEVFADQFGDEFVTADCWGPSRAITVRNNGDSI